MQGVRSGRPVDIGTSIVSFKGDGSKHVNNHSKPVISSGIKRGWLEHPLFMVVLMEVPLLMGDCPLPHLITRRYHICADEDSVPFDWCEEMVLVQ